MREILKKLDSKRRRAVEGGGQSRQESQHKKGKLTSRERIEILLDEGTLKNGICLSSIDAQSLRWKTKSTRRWSGYWLWNN